MHVFIGGTPAAGKTFTSKKFIKKSDKKIHLVSIDDLRNDFAKDPKIKYWVDYFWNQDEVEYWKSITHEKAIQELVEQSEAFWPLVLEVIVETKKNYEHAIFEGVNILPRLAHKDLNFPGFFLVCEDYKTILDRNIKAPRWGNTRELQELETKHFIEDDVRFIKEEAKKFNYKVFNNEKEATEELTRLFEQAL